MNRLWVQISLTIALVALVAVATIAILAEQTASTAFRRYLSYSDTSLHQTLGEALVTYYEDQGSWEGIDQVLGSVAFMRRPMMRGPNAPRQPGTIDWEAGPVEIVLADANGRVISERHGDEIGRKLTRDERAVALDLEFEGEVIGQMVIARPMQESFLGPLEQSFLSNLRRWLVIGALVAVVVGGVLGLVISRNLTAPLQRLAEAARRLADRDFSQRVKVKGSTEIAEVSQAFNDMAAALETSERQRQNMVADVAHELRSPLTVLQGNLRAILDDVYPLDKAEVSNLYDETRLLSRLVNDLRDLAQADAGQLRLNIRPADAGQVVQRTAENLSLAAEAQEVTLEAQVPGDLPRALVDPDRLAQVLRNLLINALRHTAPGGRVIVSAAQAGETLEIAVIDTGEGIAPEDLPHVFERFWRADASRSRADTARSRVGAARADAGRSSKEAAASGSGLGLSVAQSLIEAQGGRIWAESIPGQGSAFRFTLPLVS